MIMQISILSPYFSYSGYNLIVLKYEHVQYSRYSINFWDFRQRNDIEIIFIVFTNPIYKYY